MPISSVSRLFQSEWDIWSVVEGDKDRTREFLLELERDDLDTFLLVQEELRDIGENGPPRHNLKRFRPEGAGIFAIKIRCVRIYCWYYHNQVLICANYDGSKKQRKADKQTLRKAKQLKREWDFIKNNPNAPDPKDAKSLLPRVKNPL